LAHGHVPEFDDWSPKVGMSPRVATESST